MVGADGRLCQRVVAMGQSALMAVHRTQQRLPDDDPRSVTTKVEIGLRLCRGGCRRRQASTQASERAGRRYEGSAMGGFCTVVT